MEPNFVIGIDPELARVLILIGLAATVGALLIAVVTVSSGRPADLSSLMTFP